MGFNPLQTVVTIRTTSLTIKNSTFCPHTVCVLCGSQNKQRLFPYTALIDWFYNWDGVCLLRGTDWVFKCNSRQLSSFRS